MVLPDIFIKNNILYIRFEFYAKLTKSPDYFGSHVFDEECGIIYIRDEELKDDEKTGCHFPFKIEDNKKFFLAKIKYGI